MGTVTARIATGRILARSRTALAPIVIALLSGAPACSSLQPEVGEELVACVDVDSNPAVKVDFKAQIRPLMNGAPGGPKPCASCHYHSGGTMEGLIQTGLDLEGLALLRRGGRRSGADIVVAGKPCASVIVQKLRGTFEGARMPKGGPFWSAEQIQLMTDWIAEGAQGASED